MGSAPTPFKKEEVFFSRISPLMEGLTGQRRSPGGTLPYSSGTLLRSYLIPVLSSNLSISVPAGHQSSTPFPSSSVLGVLGEQKIDKNYLQINLKIMERYRYLERSFKNIL